MTLGILATLQGILYAYELLASATQTPCFCCLFCVYMCVLHMFILIIGFLFFDQKGT